MKYPSEMKQKMGLILKDNFPFWVYLRVLFLALILGLYFLVYRL